MPPYVLGMKGPGAGNPFWAAVEAGAKAKGKPNSASRSIVVAPPAESDVQAQITQIEDLIAQGVDGIALAPTDPNALAPVVDAAKAAGIPVVFVDTRGINDGVTFIGTNNEVGAALAAEVICCDTLAGRLGSGDPAGPHHASRPARRAPMAPRRASTDCGLKVVAEQTAEWDRAKGQSVTENILDRQSQHQGRSSAPTTTWRSGAVEALKAAASAPTSWSSASTPTPMPRRRCSPATWRPPSPRRPSNMGGFGIEALVDLKAGKTIDAVDRHRHRAGDQGQRRAGTSKASS